MNYVIFTTFKPKKKTSHCMDKLKREKKENIKYKEKKKKKRKDFRKAQLNEIFSTVLLWVSESAPILLLLQKRV